MKTNRVSLATAAIAVASLVTFAPMTHAGPDACYGIPNTAAELACLKANPPTNVVLTPQPVKQGMTPDQLYKCCADGSCVDGGIDPGNYKGIVCDPSKPIGPGEEGPSQAAPVPPG
jgi:hypothetical protein